MQPFDKLRIREAKQSCPKSTSRNNYRYTVVLTAPPDKWPIPTKQPQSPEEKKRKLSENYIRRRETALAKGLCTQCCKEPPDQNRASCSKCRKKINEWARQKSARRREEVRANGLCPECGKKPPAQDRTKCLDCGKKASERSSICYAKKKARHEALKKTSPPRKKRLTGPERKALGICQNCDEPTTRGATFCTRHLDMNRENSRRHRVKKQAEQQAWSQ